MQRLERLLKAAAVLLIVLFLFIASSATPARADSDGAGTVTASALNLRGGASTSSEVLTVLPRGTAVIVTGKSDGWYQVACKGYSGYVSADYLNVFVSNENPTIQIDGTAGAGS